MQRSKISKSFATAAVSFALVLSVCVIPQARSVQAQQQALRERAKAAVAQTSGELKVAGLREPVEIIRDTWGVPHIYAKNQDDLFFAQGFTVAQDRLWQLELWHRKAMGQLAEAFGPEYVERDRIARLLQYRGDWDAEWKSYSPDTKQIAEAFVRGINTWIALIERGEAKLPIEFELMGLKPTPWTPEVIVSRMAAYPMTGNVSREIARAQVVHALGPERAALLFPTDPERIVRPEEGLSLEGIDERVLAAVNRAAGEVSFDGEIASRMSKAFQRRGHREHGEEDAALSELNARLNVLQFGIPDSKSQIQEGSNNWTIAGAKTKSAKPILANDPHRALLLPSLRYVVHLVAPGWDVIGAGEPALPGVSIGHNQRIAFGLTIFAADQQDIVIETMGDDTQGKSTYLSESTSSDLEFFQPFDSREVVLPVKGESTTRPIQLKYSKQGPIIGEDKERKRAFALRWVGNEPGTAGYLAGLAISRAQNWKEFRAALTRWKLPPENFVYADVDGNIGYQAAALVPNRRCDGLLPVRGDQRTCDWNGWLTLDDLPHAFNPKQKFYATANNNNLPPDVTRLIGFEWSAPFRADRVKEVLAAGSHLTVEDSTRLQADIVSLPAREMKPLLEFLPRGECKAGADNNVCAAEMLRTWDGRVEKDSAAAAIFAVWMTRLREKIYRPLVPENVWRPAAGLISLPAVIRVLRDADPLVFGETSEMVAAQKRDGKFPQRNVTRNAALAQALAEAVAELEKRLGPDMSKWRWGAMHTASFTHPLAGRSSTEFREFNLGPVEKSGDGNTVNAAGGGNYRHTSGASYRQVVDLSDWDNSKATNVPGQSGQPGSEFYDNLLPLWARDEHFPLVYSRAAVEKHVRATLTLTPKKN